MFSIKVEDPFYDVVDLVERAEASACRGCLATDTHLFDLHAQNLAEAFGQLIGATEPVSRMDGLPQHLCSTCRYQLQNYIHFRARMIASQSFLQSIQEQNKFPITTGFIRSLDTSQMKLNLNKSNVLHIDIEPYPSGDEVMWTCAEDHKKVVPDIVVEVSDEEGNQGLKEEDSEGSAGEEDHDSEGNTEDEVEAPSEPEIEIETVKTEEVTAHVETVTTMETNVDHPDSADEDITEPKFKYRKFSNEDYVNEFKEKYECDVLVLTKEQQRAAVEARRESANYKQSKFKCDVCFKGFHVPSTLNKHMVVHDLASGRYDCDACHTRFQRRHVLNRHAKRHQLVFVCRQCSHRSKSSSLARMHYRLHKGHTFECRYCGKSFSKITTQYTHMRKHHSAVACDLCGERYVDSKGLAQHMKRCHKEALTARCAKCKVLFARLHALDTHLNAFPDRRCDDTLRSCAQCGENFATDDLLAAHAQENHKTVYKCDKCGRVYKSERTLAHHACRARSPPAPPPAPDPAPAPAPRRARRPAPYTRMCEVCGIGKMNNFQLRRHMMVHTGEKPYQCTLCPKKYRVSIGLQYHMNMHTGTRPYKCKLCPKTFFNPADRNTHRLVHTKEMNFKCPLCGKACRSKKYVAIHIRIFHHKEPWPKRDRRKKPLPRKDTTESDPNSDSE